MAEGEEERGAVEAQDRSDWFGREIGTDWVEIEPGIYEHRPIRLAEPPSTPAPIVATPLDQELLESLPKTEEADPEPMRAPEESSEWWRFSL